MKKFTFLFIAFFMLSGCSIVEKKVDEMWQNMPHNKEKERLRKEKQEAYNETRRLYVKKVYENSTKPGGTLLHYPQRLAYMLYRIKNRQSKPGVIFVLSESGLYSVSQKMDDGYLFKYADPVAEVQKVFLITNKTAFEHDPMDAITPIVQYIGVRTYRTIFGASKQMLVFKDLSK